MQILYVYMYINVNLDVYLVYLYSVINKLLCIQMCMYACIYIITDNYIYIYG